MPLIGTRGAASAQGFGEFAQQSSGVQANAIDFDGTNDYLSRSTDLVGNFNGKTFTFSFWVCNYSGGTGRVYRADGNGSSFFDIYITNSTLVGNLTNTVGSNTLSFTLPWGGTTIINNTWYNIIVSIDLASSANRYVYVNDINVTSSVTWTTYSNTVSAFSQPNHFVAAGSGGGSKLTGRLSNVFLDRTYRDLSIEANRRLFVTADLKPAANQQALNPILYLPMSDPTQPGLNQGTGGNFTLTGTVARSGRGPNQYNAPYSDLDGTADYLERASVTGMANTSTFTFACSFILDVTTNSYIAQCGGNEFAVRVQSGQLRLLCYATGSVLLVSATVDITGGFVVGRNYTVTISIDTTNSSKRHVYVNGTAATVTWSTYTSGSIYFAQTWRIGREATTLYFNGRLGALWFNTSYIDLSVPANLAKFVTGTGIDAKPVDLGANGELPTGTSPLIYLPMYGNNAGKNYGTGGDFTVNSGPYLGARGPNEFWGNKATGFSTTKYLSRSTMSGVSANKTVSGCVWLNVSSFGSTGVVLYGSYGLRIQTTTSNTQPLTFSATNSSTNLILSVQTNTTTFGTGTYYCVMFCFDMSDSGKRFVYVNDVSQSLIVSTYTNQNIAHDLMSPYIGYNGSSNFLTGGIAELYMTNSYIDFSQEANRLKFRDAFGNPVDLTQQIQAAAIPTPAIYMRFDPASFGTNSGTGGNFTVNGTITDGGQL